MAGVSGVLGAGKDLARSRHFVDGIGDFVADRLERAQIGDDRVHVGVGDDVVESGRHHRGDGNAVRPHPGAQQLLDVVVAPPSDAGLLVGCDVRRSDVERRLVEAQAAGKILARNHVRRTFGRMAIAAGHDGVDEIRAALDRRVGASAADECQRSKRERYKPYHDPSPIPARTLLQRAVAANQTCVVRANVSSCGYGTQQKGQRRLPSMRIVYVRSMPRRERTPRPARERDRNPCPWLRRRDRRTRSPQPARNRRNGSRLS